MSDSERRKHSRFPIRLDVDLMRVNGEFIECHSVDMSYRGVRLRTDCKFDVGDELGMTFWLGGRGSGFGLRLSGAVAHLAADGIGVHTQKIPYDSFQNLRQLVEFNAEDPKKAAHEIDVDLGLANPEALHPPAQSSDETTSPSPTELDPSRAE